MPTYDYQCQSCTHTFTAMHKIGDTAPGCPQCGGEVKKLLSAPAVHGAPHREEVTPCGMPAAEGCGSGMCGHLH
ncbi:FmdB family zinc ribbon protein [Candidatus Methylocalor cossyra]|uniref:Regulatory protein, FmdB family n=1 Tax=Candidatus Methylocalor cossyra TaxID=3108543 RepID=A0ABM9NH64_9GAMM